MQQFQEQEGADTQGERGDGEAASASSQITHPTVLAAAAYGLAALVLWVFLRPDPLLHARTIACTPAATGAPAGEEASGPPALARGRFSLGIALGGAAMVLTQIVMLAIMTMTPIHMQAHGHGLGATGLVIAVHIAFMYLPSPLTGVLVDRIGRKPVLVASGATLLAAGLVAAMAPVDSVAVLAIALALLGLGWNFGLLAGTAMVTDAAAHMQTAYADHVPICEAIENGDVDAARDSMAAHMGNAT